MKYRACYTILSLTLSLIFSIGVCAGNHYNPYQTKKDKLEKIALAEISAVPEVKKFFKDCPKDYKFDLMIAKEPDSTYKYYWIKVGTNNFDIFRTTFNFYIDPKTSRIYYWDQLNDMDDPIITLQQWRHWRSNPGFQKRHIYKGGKLIVLKTDD